MKKKLLVWSFLMPILCYLATFGLYAVVGIPQSIDGRGSDISMGLSFYYFVLLYALRCDFYKLPVIAAEVVAALERMRDDKRLGPMPICFSYLLGANLFAVAYLRELSLIIEYAVVPSVFCVVISILFLRRRRPR